ncbi:DMT family transporter [Dongia sedimenti]|uniref:DMT family transporter n=1 Tax=Dongia sedimenti TaxID=3064282 RepID=A0ABU0YHC7_9PROT|nr:DMT family transporter [Rhodospirillaceae bacterium R-7]
MSASQHRPILGAGLMLCALAMLPGMDAIAKKLSETLPTVEVTWGRFLFYALVIGPIAFAKFGRRALRPARPGLQILRGLLFAGSAYAFFLSIAELPLADTMAVFFIYPMIVLLASALLLGERIGALRWAMVVLGFAGALLVMQPSLEGISTGNVFALLSGAGYAFGMMVTRRLAPHDPGLVTGLTSALTGVVLYSFAMPFVWVAPSSNEWLWLIGVGVIAALGHYLLIVAHQMATAAQLAPYGYAEIVSAIFFGLIVFGNWPTPIVWLGILVIVASGVVVTWANARLEGARPGVSEGAP